eukprot:gene3642-4176_t
MICTDWTVPFSSRDKLPNYYTIAEQIGSAADTTGGTGVATGQAQPNGIVTDLVTALAGALTLIPTLLSTVTPTPTPTVTTTPSTTTGGTPSPTPTSPTVSYYGGFWKDVNNNGIRDVSEPALANVEAILIGGATEVTYNTGATGEISIPALNKNTNYCLKLNLAGQDKAIRTKVLPSTTYVSNPTNWTNICFSVVTSPIVTDTYSIQEHKIDGSLWIDSNGNGVRDGGDLAGEDNLYGLGITFYPQSSEFVGYTGHTNTDEFGYYFANIIPGAYCTQTSTYRDLYSKVPPATTYTVSPAPNPGYCFTMPATTDFSKPLSGLLWVMELELMVLGLMVRVLELMILVLLVRVLGLLVLVRKILEQLIMVMVLELRILVLWQLSKAFDNTVERLVDLASRKKPDQQGQHLDIFGKKSIAK